MCKKLKSSSASFGCDHGSDGNTSFYTVNADVPLYDIANRLMALLTQCSFALEHARYLHVAKPYKGERVSNPEITLHELRFMLSALDEASGLCLAILNTIEDFEEEGQNNETVQKVQN